MIKRFPFYRKVGGRLIKWIYNVYDHRGNFITGVATLKQARKRLATL